jgi:hypothetical protein
MSKSIISLLFFTGLLLSSCALVNNSSVTLETAEKNSSPMDTVFIDYEPTLPETKYHVFRASKDGKSGWMNVEGDWIIPPEYDNEFSRGWFEGINVCRQEGKYGAVNYEGDIVIPFEYLYPPSNCSDGLILVKDSLNQEAYFSKKGIRLTTFKQRQPEFRNGYAIVKSNREEFARYPRVDMGNSNRTTRIHKGDFIVVNTQFDTLLQFTDVPFLLEFGTLNNNRRSFFLYPYIGLHADIGISYGNYGYLNQKGKIVIEPKFRASDVFIPVRGGFVRNPNCPFYSNLSMVRELDSYYFIDTIGNKVFELQTNREQIADVSYFNNYGIAAYRTFGKTTNGTTPNTSRIHLIDSSGKVIYEAFESDASISYNTGSADYTTHYGLIPIYDQRNGVYIIYTPEFKPFATFPLEDTSKLIEYQYRDLSGEKLDNQFILTQFRSTKNSSGYPGSHQRLIDKNNTARSSWFSYRDILSSNYNNFSFVDSATMTTTLYDFKKSVLYACDSCFFQYGYKLNKNGIYKVILSNEKWAFVNYQGKVLSERFDSLEEEVYDLTDQVETFNIIEHNTIGAKEIEFEKLFNESIMFKRIIR